MANRIITQMGGPTTKKTKAGRQKRKKRAELLRSFKSRVGSKVARKVLLKEGIRPN